MKLKKSICFLLFFTLCAIILIIAITIIFNKVNSKYGQFTVTVVDAYTDMPLSEAIIVIPECNKVFHTDRNGKALCIGIDIFINSELERILPTKKGEVTILCYAEGYLDFALFNASVTPLGVGEKKLYMFPQGSEDGRTFITMNETPDDSFTQALLKKYSVYFSKTTEPDE
ncbi:MAG: hypothetical protein IJO48_01510 [Clostridia bacterium]|nr:hypothetical protein [Clostridia bacterium]